MATVHLCNSIFIGLLSTILTIPESPFLLWPFINIFLVPTLWLSTLSLRSPHHLFRQFYPIFVLHLPQIPLWQLFLLPSAKAMFTPVAALLFIYALMISNTSVRFARSPKHLDPLLLFVMLLPATNSYSLTPISMRFFIVFKPMV